MATYRFTLRHPDGVDIFGTEQVSNWDKIVISLTQHNTYNGILREFSNTFEFVDSIRNRLILLLDKYGYDVSIYMSIEKGNDNADKWSFEAIGEELKADIQSIEITELNCKVNFTDSEFVAKVMNRHDTKTNLDVTESIDGDSIGILSYDDISLHDRKLVLNTRAKVVDFQQELMQFGTSTDWRGGDDGITDSKYLVLPIEYDYKSDSSFQYTPMVMANLWAMALNSLYYNASQDITLSFTNFRVKGKIEMQNMTGGVGWTLKFSKSKNGPPVKTQWSLARSKYYGGTIENFSVQNGFYGIQEYEFDETWSGDVSLSKGESLQLVFQFQKLFNPTLFTPKLTIDLIEFECTGVSTYQPTISKTLLPHELFSRLIEIYTGETNRFYSDFFGRKSLGYTRDGEGAYCTVQNGRMLRNFPADEFQLNTSLKEAFESFNSIYCLNATIENVNGVDVFRIEPYNKFKDGKVAVRLGEMLNDISRKINPKRIFQTIEIGYKDQEYEELNGTFQYNGEVNYSAPMITEGATLAAISKYRADDIGIELTRRLQYADNPSKDYRSDKDIFLIDAMVDGVSLRAVKDDGFDLVLNIYESGAAYNLNITPARNLRRWGAYLRAGYIGIEDRSLKFVKGASNPNLSTHKTGESDTISEDADVLISDLDAPIETAEMILIAEASITDAEFNTLLNNRGSLIQLSNKGVNVFGRVSECEFDTNKKSINFELNRGYGI